MSDSNAIDGTIRFGTQTAQTVSAAVLGAPGRELVLSDANAGELQCGLGFAQPKLPDYASMLADLAASRFSPVDGFATQTEVMSHYVRILTEAAEPHGGELSDLVAQADSTSNYVRMLTGVAEPHGGKLSDLAAQVDSTSSYVRMLTEVAEPHAGRFRDLAAEMDAHYFGMLSDLAVHPLKCGDLAAQATHFGGYASLLASLASPPVFRNSFDMRNVGRLAELLCESEESLSADVYGALVAKEILHALDDTCLEAPPAPSPQPAAPRVNFVSKLFVAAEKTSASINARSKISQLLEEFRTERAISQKDFWQFRGALMADAMMPTRNVGMRVRSVDGFLGGWLVPADRIDRQLQVFISANDRSAIMSAFAAYMDAGGDPVEFSLMHLRAIFEKQVRERASYRVIFLHRFNGTHAASTHAWVHDFVFLTGISPPVIGTTPAKVNAYFSIKRFGETDVSNFRSYDRAHSDGPIYRWAAEIDGARHLQRREHAVRLSNHRGRLLLRRRRSDAGRRKARDPSCREMDCDLRVAARCRAE